MCMMPLRLAITVSNGPTKLFKLTTAVALIQQIVSFEHVL